MLRKIYKSNEQIDVPIKQKTLTPYIISSVIVCLIIPIIGGVIYFISGLYTYFTRYYFTAWRNEIAIRRVSDRRYKVGYREEQYTQNVSYKIEAKPEEISHKQKRGIFYIIFGVISAIGYIIIFKSIK